MAKRIPFDLPQRRKARLSCTSSAAYNCVLKPPICRNASARQKRNEPGAQSRTLISRLLNSTMNCPSKGARSSPMARVRSRIQSDNDMSTQEVVYGSRDRGGLPVSTACEQAVKTFNTLFPCWRQVAKMLRMLATKRSPVRLSLP